jgi:hypothetical protein
MRAQNADVTAIVLLLTLVKNNTVLNNVREHHRGNHEWQIQRRRHWEQDTKNKQKLKRCATK